MTYPARTCCNSYVDSYHADGCNSGPAAPDTTGGELREDVLTQREHLAVWLTVHAPMLPTPYALAGALLAPDGPLRDLLAERDTLAAQVQAVEELAKDLNTDARSMWTSAEAHESETDEMVGDTYFEASKRLRRALGTPTTGAGEQV